jgi:hypothetical protein
MRALRRRPPDKYANSIVMKTKGRSAADPAIASYNAKNKKLGIRVVTYLKCNKCAGGVWEQMNR